MDEMITIGMPTKNRAHTIDRVLNSILLQTYPKDKIKIVFVDESDDDTYEKLLQWTQKNKNVYNDIMIITDFKSDGYISAARNVCVANMKGEVILFWDSDVVAPDDDSITRIISLLKDDSVGAAGLPYYAEQSSLYERTRRSKELIGGMGFTAIKSKVFNEIGLFNEKLKILEDTDLITRIKVHGLKVSFDKSTPALHLKVKKDRLNLIKGYFSRLKGRFTYESLVVDELIKAGSKAQLLRLFYYFFLPILIVFWIVNLFFVTFSIFSVTIIVTIYTLMNLLYQVWKTRNNRLMGIVNFLYVTPMGVTQSYGYVFRQLKYLFGIKS